MRPFQSGLLAPSLVWLSLPFSLAFHSKIPTPSAMAMRWSIVGLVVMIVLFLLLFLLICKPWRLLFSSPRRSMKVDDIEKPFISNDSPTQRNDLPSSYSAEGPSNQLHMILNSSRTHGLVKQRIPSAGIHANQGSSLILDLIPEPSEDLLVGQTLKHSLVSTWPLEDRKPIRIEEKKNDLTSIAGLTSATELTSGTEDDTHQHAFPQGITDQRSSLTLEVISGPSCGLRCSIQSTDTSRLPLTLGRVPPSDLLLKDTEVSGKHAMINWNSNKLKWELMDMGSLNGTLLNSHVVRHPEMPQRNWSEPFELAHGDVITFGKASKVYVQITWHDIHSIPFGVGMASDPMSLRRGGKQLPMEDVCYYQWPFPEIDQFGLFGIFDGHGGVAAAKSASKTLPKMVADMLAVSERRERVVALSDASEILRDAFFQAEATMNHQYEGCTATVLLVWADQHEDFYAQCANVGDSACVINIGEKHITMTEDHRITSQSERDRLRKSGPALKEGETRLCGLNIGRMLGDKFLKEQEARFSSEPYVSKAVHIPRGSNAFALMASDGLWDVISIKKAAQLVLQTREKYSVDRGKASADRIVNFVLSEARTLRTRDNTSILFIDFDCIRTASCNYSS